MEYSLLVIIQEKNEKLFSIRIRRHIQVWYQKRMKKKSNYNKETNSYREKSRNRID